MYSVTYLKQTIPNMYLNKLLLLSTYSFFFFLKQHYLRHLHNFQGRKTTVWRQVGLQSQFVFNVLQRVKRESQHVNPNLPQISEYIYIYSCILTPYKMHVISLHTCMHPWPLSNGDNVMLMLALNVNPVTFNLVTRMTCGWKFNKFSYNSISE